MDKNGLFGQVLGFALSYSDQCTLYKRKRAFQAMFITYLFIV